MKIIYASLLTLSMLFCFFISSAQLQTGKPFLSIGPELGWDSEAGYKYSIGTSAKFGLPVSRRLAITVSSGYSNFRGRIQKTFSGTDARNLDMSIIPVRIGFRYHFYKSMYVEPQVGYSKVQFERKYVPGFQAYNYGVNLGILKSKHLDISAQYQGFKSRNITTNSTTTQYRFSTLSYGQNLHSVGIRVGYNFNLKR